ncbi:hypothetical protein BLOT_015472 [Blomia tropicalis]|nr:hypothetical protein BLOT_015472 [Blomia tropicalis]
MFTLTHETKIVSLGQTSTIILVHGIVILSQYYHKLHIKASSIITSRPTRRIRRKWRICGVRRHNAKTYGLDLKFISCFDLIEYFMTHYLIDPQSVLCGFRNELILNLESSIMV